MSTNVCDISSCGMLQVSGQDAARFLSTMYTGQLPSVSGDMTVEDGLFLNAEGQVVDAAHIVRLGAEEFLIVCAGENADELQEWLEAHAELSDDDGPVFAGVQVTDVSSLLALLVLYGKGAERVLADIVSACEGKVTVMGLPYKQAGGYFMPQWPAYLLVAPVNAASSIGDFLMGDLNVEAVDYDAYASELEARGAYVPQLYGAEYVKPADVGLEGLLRSDGGFVGARALGL